MQECVPINDIAIRMITGETLGKRQSLSLLKVIKKKSTL